MDERNISIGDEVIDSPIGEGKVTGFNPDGYPEINGQPVSYFTRKDGAKYGAFGTLDTPTRKMGRPGPESKPVEPMGLHSMGGKTDPKTQPGFHPESAPNEAGATATDAATATGKPADTADATNTAAKPADAASKAPDATNTDTTAKGTAVKPMSTSNAGGLAAAPVKS